ncbi:ubiquitin-conjugating enzyme/RWD-like protein [Chaetomium strumarium]|uniref:E2 ubiquitin-conjugating enzyme n=1 Tax=Chaetomium strumarium TaxID=1170767 RepID=A0AAJ0GWG4_9PEZI|nr:ubiquitin-conjugating enzyme/RWD-like protein [Chaetomium strumarium]
MASQKRIAKELTECTSSPPVGVTVFLPKDSDLHRWHAILDGPENTVYQGGKFGLVISLPTDYPFKAPTITFATRIYHPNITNDNLGNICLPLLKAENWKPSTRLLSVLEALRQLLVEPLPDDPLEARIADEYRSDRKEFEKTARNYVQRYAKGTPKFDSSGDDSTAAQEGQAGASGSGGGGGTGGS